MKKLLITAGSILIMNTVVILFVNATGSKKDTKKAGSENIKIEASMPCSATCNHSTGEKPATCDPATCTTQKEGKCDPATCTAHKDGKCDPATCTAHKDSADKGGEECNPAAGCQATCSMKPAGIK